VRDLYHSFLQAQVGTDSDKAAIFLLLRVAQKRQDGCIFPWFTLHAASTLKSWLCGFFISFTRQLKIHNIGKRALIVAIPKLNKPFKDPKGYQYYPISLLCVPFKNIERLIYSRIEPLIDTLLPQEQGFPHGTATVDYVTLLTQAAEDNSLAKMKAESVFVDLTAEYHAICHRGLISKLLRLLHGRHMVCLIMEMTDNPASPLPPITTKERGYAASKMVSRRNRSYHPSFLTTIPLTCQSMSLESMHTPTILKSCKMLEIGKKRKSEKSAQQRHGDYR